MGLFSGVGNLLFGKSSKGYESKNTREYENKAKEGVYNRFDATKGKPVTAGTQGYNFSGYDTANAGFKNPAQFKEKYNASTFNFSGTPQTAYDAQYQLGAGDIRREGAGQLEKLRETIGPRRQGLLLKAGSDSQRKILENLARMKATLGVESARETSQLSKEQQLANAAEQYKGFQSRADLEGRQADENYRNRAALSDAERGRIALESDVTERERAYNDKALEYLMDLYSKGAGQSQQNAVLKNQARGQNLGFLGDVAGGVGSYFSSKKVKG